MTTHTSTVNTGNQRLSRFSISEDWLATGIGLAIVLIIAAGLIGPGPQTVNIRASGGETKSAQPLSIGGWQVSGTLGGQSASIERLPNRLDNGKTYIVTCAAGTPSADIADTLPDGFSAPPDGRAQLIVVNGCDEELALSYRTSAAIPWPVFNLFSR